MPRIRGDAAGGKPIISVALLPALPRLEGVVPLATPSTVDMLECRALLDTGADGTSVCHSTARAAGLRSHGKRPVIGIGGQNYHRTWGLFLGFLTEENASPFVLDEPLLAVEIPDNGWFEAIIGRDVLTKGTFTMRPGGEFEFDLPDDA